MNTTAIKRIINKKLGELSKQHPIFKDVDIYVSGGCIASMLRNEKVNDFDIYFTNKQDATEVANYLLKLFNNNYAEDRYELCDSEKGIKITVAKHHRKSLFLLSESSDVKPYEPTCVTDYAISLSDGVQIVTHFIGSPQEITRDYDFAHACCYYRPIGDKLYLPKQALLSIVTNELFYTGSPYPLGSLIRIKKFIKRGWNIKADQLLKLALNISKLNLTDSRVLQEQLIGIDIFYLNLLVQELEKTDGVIDMEKIMRLIEDLYESEWDSNNED